MGATLVVAPFFYLPGKPVYNLQPKTDPFLTEIDLNLRRYRPSLSEMWSTIS